MLLSQNESPKKGYADSFTSKVLPGGHTHEYTVISHRRNMTPLDVLVLLIMAFAIWMNEVSRDKHTHTHTHKEPLIV